MIGTIFNASERERGEVCGSVFRRVFKRNLCQKCERVRERVGIDLALDWMIPMHATKVFFAVIGPVKLLVTNEALEWLLFTMNRLVPRV